MKFTDHGRKERIYIMKLKEINISYDKIIGSGLYDTLRSRSIELSFISTDKTYSCKSYQLPKELNKEFTQWKDKVEEYVFNKLQ